MKLKKIGTPLLILILIIILGILCFYLFNSAEDSNSSEEYTQSQYKKNKKSSDSNSTTSEEHKSTETLSSTSEVKSALIENVELHATYYLEKVYVEENSYVAKGEKILKYTNGTYLIAPYDCYIVELNVPDEESKVLNSHYVQIQSKNILTVSMKIDETKINIVKVGDEGKITISAIDKTFSGYITHIGSTASDGKFTIDIEFENDGNVKLGMTATILLQI
ncbi:MAG: hypothetical protein IJK18_09495 [Clostridia bacterium]|nr:hypothetical protein [Clostridia bacterium]